MKKNKGIIIFIIIFLSIGLLYPSYVNASVSENKSKLTNFIEEAVFH